MTKGTFISVVLGVGTFACVATGCSAAPTPAPPGAAATSRPSTSPGLHDASALVHSGGAERATLAARVRKPYASVDETSIYVDDLVVAAVEGGMAVNECPVRCAETGRDPGLRVPGVERALTPYLHGSPSGPPALSIVVGASVRARVVGEILHSACVVGFRRFSLVEDAHDKLESFTVGFDCGGKGSVDLPLEWLIVEESSVRYERASVPDGLLKTSAFTDDTDLAARLNKELLTATPANLLVGVVGSVPISRLFAVKRSICSAYGAGLELECDPPSTTLFMASSVSIERALSDYGMTTGVAGFGKFVLTEPFRCAAYEKHVRAKLGGRVPSATNEICIVDASEDRVLAGVPFTDRVWVFSVEEQFGVLRIVGSAESP